MARAYDGAANGDDGGVITLNDLRQTRPNYAVQQEKSPLEIIERVLSIPELKPIYEQGARLIGAYADKMSLDNQMRYSKLTSKSMPTNSENNCLYGVGSKQP